MILKEEYKKMRLDKDRSYKVTVRALESLIRLGEAMARAHCDTEIKPAYVKEVCRLMRNSNIKLVRNDMEFGPEQDMI
jgi:DNA replication licensing factor MCM6